MPGLLVDDIECGYNDAVSALLFACVRLFPHDPVDQPFNDRYIRLVELMAAVFAAGMHHDSRTEIYISPDAHVLSFDL